MTRELTASLRLLILPILVRLPLRRFLVFHDHRRHGPQGPMQSKNRPNAWVKSSSTGSSTGFEEESEDVDDGPSDELDGFLDSPLVQCASPRALLPPHLRKEATYVLLTLLSETFGPRRTSERHSTMMSTDVETSSAYVHCNVS